MIKFSQHSGVFRLESRQFLNTPLNQAWEYFTDSKKLQDITPPEMNFVITSPEIRKGTFQGKIITYKVSPFPFMRSSWITEIKAVKNEKYFIDEQRFGPYKFWHHTHYFFSKDRGTEMIDQVYYKMPLGFLGRIANKIIVRKKLKRIFSYRYEYLEKVFNK